MSDDTVAIPATKTQEVAVFAMGCFWCGESEFRDHETGTLLPGIITVLPGYMGPEATGDKPTYENHEGYREAVQVTFDPSRITYQALLNIFWKNVDVFDERGQFCDKGAPYKSGIYYMTDQQKKLAEETRLQTAKSLGIQVSQIKTDLIDGGTFYVAEEYHQNYKFKNPLRYKYYRWNCGRDQRLKAIWASK